MSKTETLVLAAQIEENARKAIARAKGEIAACHRKTIAHLMPKFDTEAEANAFRDGFDTVRADLEK